MSLVGVSKKKRARTLILTREGGPERIGSNVYGHCFLPQTFRPLSQDALSMPSEIHLAELLSNNRSANLLSARNSSYAERLPGGSRGSVGFHLSTADGIQATRSIFIRRWHDSGIATARRVDS